ncbi:hypothetical protein OG372_07195 [Streptomyces sp. NBC_01020]|uniref:hypothetical protein n=1 Tax=unclassified Streptomyces TaxID=2593676 RepID=UPI002E236A8B|nr:hypothetical protein OG372_07195 [Streptomyces sp. NBC_01020]
MTGDGSRVQDGWAQAVRSRLGLGRLLPLGGARDGAWIAEDAAAAVLRRAAGGVPGVALGKLRIAPAETGGTARSAVPAPPSALPPGPLRVEAEAEAAAGGESLPAAVERLRDALFGACADALGLEVAEVDVRVTGLLDAPSDPSAPGGPNPPPVVGPDRGAAAVRGPEAEAAAAVPGVARLTGVLGDAVHRTDHHVRVELAVAAGRRALDVAGAVRSAVAAAAGADRSVAVLVTAVELP